MLTGLEPAWEQMILDVSRQSARASMKQIRREEMQGEIYTVTLTILCEDEPRHTDDHPFCDDMNCPCRKDTSLEGIEYFDSIIEHPFYDGLITNAEAHRLYFNENI